MSERVHELKLWPEFYAPVMDGAKTFELRKDDRGYRVGDTLILKEWTKKGGYTGREISAKVSYLISGVLPFPDAPDLSGWVIMGIDIEGQLTTLRKELDITQQAYETETALAKKLEKENEELRAKYDDLWLVSTAHALDADQYRTALEKITTITDPGSFAIEDVSLATAIQIAIEALTTEALDKERDKEVGTLKARVQEEHGNSVCASENADYWKHFAHRYHKALEEIANHEDLDGDALVQYLKHIATGALERGKE